MIARGINGDTAPSVDTIKRITAGAFGVSVRDLVSSRRDGPTVLARHVAMWLARRLTPMSFPAIGRHFGDRDHTSVMHGVRRVERLLESDAGVGAVALGLMDALTLPAQRRAA